jgi:hypothetical protein
MTNARTILASGLLAFTYLCVGCQPSASRTGGDEGLDAAVDRQQAPAVDGGIEPARATSEPELANQRTKPALSAATSPGKPLPPIAFDYRILGTPVAGQPLEIEISTGVEAALADLNVVLSGNERLLVPIEMARLRLAAAAAGQRATRTVRVTPVASGTVYLDVLLEAEIDGRQQSRAVTIPIRVGGDATPEPPAGTPSTDAEGTPIISLPGRDD